ncbi:MAG: hypothetical protein OEQ29_18785 [Alphaproteobacteria bacterium]|nr:hypothetical protein [Alphaproteobacteria bacterium]
MSNQRLIDRQSSLIEYLLDPRAFGAGVIPGPVPPELAGLDPNGLKINGLFSLGKRKEKIAATIPRTWAELGGKPQYDFFSFASSFRQIDPTRLSNAAQFVRYLEQVWDRVPAEPPWLPDIARYELATVRALDGANKTDATVPAEIPRPAVRRRRGVELLVCDYDLRSLVDTSVDAAAPSHRTTRLAVVATDGGRDLHAFELALEPYDLLRRLDAWRAVEGIADPAGDFAAMADALAKRGLLELAE